MKNKIYIFLAFFFVATASTFAFGDTTKTKYDLEDDDPVLSAIDAVTLSGYFESLGLNDNFAKSTKYKYSRDSVPEFDSLTYAKRFKALDANSPFNFVYNGYVKAYVNLYAKRRKKILEID